MCASKQIDKSCKVYGPDYNRSVPSALQVKSRPRAPQGITRLQSERVMLIVIVEGVEGQRNKSKK
jgi:hypothetical protein